MAPRLMPNMTLDQQIVGVRRAVRTLRARKVGPIWLLPSLRKRLRHLLAERKRRMALGRPHSGNGQSGRKTQDRS
jgi:hypothetical protein